MMPDERSHADAELLQHARTLRWMGVDWLPRRAVQSDAVPAAVMIESKPAGVSQTPGTRVVRASAPVGSSAASPTARAPTPSDEGAGAAEVPVLAAVPRHPLADSDPARIDAQRRLDELRERYEREAPHAKFVTDHHSIVFGEGDPKAKLMFVGEAPGAEEDKVGRPFVGRAGQLLDKMIAALGLARHDVYIANVLKTRPPNNATPTFEEAAACAPYLFEQIMIVDPVCIVALGLPASRTLLNTTQSMSSLRGSWWTYQPPMELTARGARAIKVMPTYHPAFLLRSYTKENRAKVWSDLQKAGERVGATSKRAE